MCPSVDLTLCMEWENEKRDHFLEKFLSGKCVSGGMLCTCIHVHTCGCSEGREEGRVCVCMWEGEEEEEEEEGGIVTEGGNGRTSQEITYPSSKCRAGCGGDNFCATNCGREKVRNGQMYIQSYI